MDSEVGEEVEEKLDVVVEWELDREVVEELSGEADGQTNRDLEGLELTKLEVTDDGNRGRMPVNVVDGRVIIVVGLNGSNEARLTGMLVVLVLGLGSGVKVVEAVLEMFERVLEVVEEMGELVELLGEIVEIGPLVLLLDD
ncbi:hypothetical protein CORC01_03919 [Colletotrichum orchidophilum]|uniref:Uncharacterized protein n=1 Tax=Colletotrichum orchidophilum TaxID=1209926 RepID=A0A1G4BHJ0_9PEZI|nr:uncharacterized protein CORC01_03919 [Colletotrichum orchidophilum]OHF00845.1 hypothetical protein CORC01_03919 [Colletotrichum orchidophilum]